MKHVYAIIIMGFFNLALFAGETKEDAFWRWFQKNDERLFAFENDREAIFKDLNNAMKSVDADLTFEFGPVSDNGQREFVVSAGGIKTAFKSVERLCAAAPKMQRWKIVKFRQRRTPIHDLAYADKKVRAADVHFLLFEDENRGKVGIMVFLDGYKEDEKSKWGQIGYLLLDEALGEYDVETKVGAIVFQSRESKYYERAHPLAELAKDFDDYFAAQKK